MRVVINYYIHNMPLIHRSWCLLSYRNDIETTWDGLNEKDSQLDKCFIISRYSGFSLWHSRNSKANISLNQRVYAEICKRQITEKITQSQTLDVSCDTTDKHERGRTLPQSDTCEVWSTQITCHANPLIKKSKVHLQSNKSHMQKLAICLVN